MLIQGTDYKQDHSLLGLFGLEMTDHTIQADRIELNDHRSVLNTIF